jgi:magnesium and cobalt exporter, CNNM family
VVAKEPYSRFPVYQESYDDVIGFIHVRDLLDQDFTSGQLTVADINRPVKLLPISKTVLSALSEMRRDRAHLAIVMDEYGGTAGIITLEDLVEELVGDIQDEYDVDVAQPKQLRGGAVEVDGLLNLDEFAEQTGIELPEGPYETVAGYMLATLGQLPVDHEKVEVNGHVLTVLEMDGRRIARVRVDPVGPPAEPAYDPATPSTSVTSTGSPDSAGTPATPDAHGASGADGAASAGGADGAAAPAAADPPAAASPAAPPSTSSSQPS